MHETYKQKREELIKMRSICTFMRDEEINGRLFEF